MFLARKFGGEKSALGRVLGPSHAVLIFLLCMTPGLSNAMAQQNQKASAEQEARMLEMVEAAIEDLYTGFLGEAKGRFREIMAQIEKLGYSPRLHWMAYDSYGEFLLAIGDNKGAIKALTRAVEGKHLAEHDASRSIMYLADAYIQLGTTDEALKLLKAAVEAYPDDHALMLYLGSAYRQTRQYDLARQTYQKVIAQDPKNGDAYGDLGNVYLEQGDTENAVAQYELCASFSNNKRIVVKNFLNAGFRYYDARQYEKALVLYKRALEVAPDNPLAYTDIGWTLAGLGRREEAIASFKHALTFNPPKDVRAYAEAGLKQARESK